MQCDYCNHPLQGSEDKYPEPVKFYRCQVCGPVRLKKAAAEKIKNGDFSASQMPALGIYNRNEFENRGRKRKNLSLRRWLLTRMEKLRVWNGEKSFA